MQFKVSGGDVEVEEIYLTTGPRRGKIIRRNRIPQGTTGGGVPMAPHVAPGVGSPVVIARRGGGLAKCILSFLMAVPALYIVGMHWTGPGPVGATEADFTPQAHSSHDRFATIQREILDRFEVDPHRGTVMPKPQPVRAKAKMLSKIPTGHSTPVTIQSAKISPQSLEGAVYKVLRKYGKPSPYGKELAAAIVREALAQNYDPVFVAAVIKSESAFDSFARSHKGAEGLMQIMPKTGAWLADKADLPKRKLTDPIHNLRLGISYLKELEAEYHGNRVLTLIAYNWGPGHVKLASSGSRKVPGEVMQYAVKILNDYRRWTTELG